MILWLNGQMLEDSAARINPADRGVLLGDGVFETMLSLDGRIIDLDRHLVRLRSGLNAIVCTCPYTDDDLRIAAQNVLERSGLATGRASLRLTVTRGAAARGLTIPEAVTPTCLITAARAPEAPGSLRVITADAIRNEHSITSRIKSLNYLDNILAKHDATAQGVDDALMLNTSGNVACASAANVWMVDGTRLITPPVKDGALPGIVRDRIFDLAATLRCRAIEEPLLPQRLRDSDGAFLTNSLIGVVPIATLDQQPLPQSPLAVQLRESYWAHTRS